MTRKKKKMNQRVQFWYFYLVFTKSTKLTKLSRPSKNALVRIIWFSWYTRHWPLTKIIENWNACSLRHLVELEKLFCLRLFANLLSPSPISKLLSIFASQKLKTSAPQQTSQNWLLGWFSNWCFELSLSSADLLKRRLHWLWMPPS